MPGMNSRKRLPSSPGLYYTGVGDIDRQIVEEHLDIFLDADINAEVAKGQWEFQIFGMKSLC